MLRGKALSELPNKPLVRPEPRQARVGAKLDAGGLSFFWRSTEVFISASRRDGWSHVKVSNQVVGQLTRRVMSGDVSTSSLQKKTGQISGADSQQSAVLVLSAAGWGSMGHKFTMDPASLPAARSRLRT